MLGCAKMPKSQSDNEASLTVGGRFRLILTTWRSLTCTQYQQLESNPRPRAHQQTAIATETPRQVG